LTAERSKEPRRVRLWLYTAFSVVAAVAVALIVVRRWGTPSWGAVAFFYALLVIGLTTSVDVPISGVRAGGKPARSVTLSPGFIVFLTAVFSTSPSTVVIVALLPTFSLSEWRRPDGARIAFNAAQETLSFGAAATVFASLHAALGATGLLIGAALAALVAEVLNTLLVAGWVSIDRRLGLVDAVRRMAWTIPHSLTFALCALLVSTLYKEFGAVAAFFLFMPLVALRFVRKSKLDLDAAHDRAIREFVRAVELKDPYTRNHSERVAEIAVAIHRELGTPEKELSDRYLAALLHDVGKVVVPAAVLTKPGSLTTEEFEQVKRHVTAGAEAVRRIDVLAHLANEVLLHHERLDGAGYPNGLRAGDIPRDVRILSVADCFEAMTSARVYRSALSVSDATAELRRVTGTQLDGDCVEALIRVIESGIVFAKPASVSVRAAERFALGQM
jgi:putative nucleotidyltransferase with HDIG domain